MQTLDDLEDYIEKTEDLQLGMMVEIVKEYGTSIPQILQTIKEKHVANEEKDKAEVIFSTVHRCKGMEYDVVQLVDDFISEKKLQQLIERSKQDNELTKLNEEINLLYVAVTRTRNILLLPENLVPSGLTRSPQIHILRNIAQDAKERAKVVGKQPASSSRWQKEPQPSRWLREPQPPDSRSGKASSRWLREPQPPESRSGKASSRWLREPQPPRTSSPTQNIPTSSSWTPDQDQTLTAMFIEGASLEAMMHYFDRTRGAIGSRIKKLQLEKRYGSGRHYS
jgi:ATP-dependent exoDNAse (exonuclease V) beta subunit